VLDVGGLGPDLVRVKTNRAFSLPLKQLLPVLSGLNRGHWLSLSSVRRFSHVLA